MSNNKKPKPEFVYLTQWIPTMDLRPGMVLVASSRTKDWREFRNGDEVPKASHKSIESVNYDLFKTGKRHGEIKWVMVNRTLRYEPNLKVPIVRKIEKGYYLKKMMEEYALV